MNIQLTPFQLEALNKLMEAMQKSARDIVLKSPTGSGKTIILTHFMSEFMQSNANTVFVWLTPGKGNLEEQSKAKMDAYIHNAQTKLLSDVMTGGFEDGDACFINWEKLTKKGNTALKDSERTNFIEWITRAHDSGLSFKIIIDESHQNFTAKADEIIQLFKTDKIIRASATPLADKNALIVEVTENEVIEQGLIKKLIAINENFPQKIETQNQTHYLLEEAEKKRLELKTEFLNRSVNVNPLVIVQLPNNSDALLENVLDFYQTKQMTTENGLVAVWLSKQHENLDGIEKNNAPQEIVIIKQAIATGWDCPRAHILVKLRDNMDETFEIQTIGRIRRMPEAHHYGCDLLDTCYLYTFDEKFTEGVKAALGDALDAKTIFLKNEYKKISLVKESRSAVSGGKDLRETTKAVAEYFSSALGYGAPNEKTPRVCDANSVSKTQSGLRRTPLNLKMSFESAGFIFSDDIVRKTVSGSAATFNEMNSSNLNEIEFREKLNTHTHGKEFHNRVGRLGQELGVDYGNAVIVVNKLFSSKTKYSEKILWLEPKQLYAFVINNFELLKHYMRESMAVNLQQQLNFGKTMQKVQKEFLIPQSALFTYDGKNRVQKVYSKNVYAQYLSSAEKRSAPEKRFEKFLEECEAVDWFYKNGDKGDEYFSLVYFDNGAAQKLFYPDYVVSVKGKIWICETKGGFDRTGNSQDIDIFSPKKFAVLKAYLEQQNLYGGFVRFDENSQELFIATEKYCDDISDSNWKPLKEVFV